MLRRIWCLIGFHRRSHGRPAWDGDRFRTTCRHCGRGLERASGARWVTSRRIA